MKTLLCFLLTTCAVFAQPSNILLIIADDFGADSFPLTATGGTTAPMPNITALKNSGVLFSRAYAHPTCSPTRASLLTGRHPYRTGIGAQLTGATSPQLSTTEFTLPDAFAANSGLGYSLAMFGKWHLNSGGGVNDSPRTVGGWPHFAGTIIGAIPDFLAWTKITNNVSAATTTYATTDLANDVISFITTRPSTTPWFAWCAFNAPHAPFHVPPSGLHTYGTPTTNRGMYEAACQALDTEVGRILTNVNLANTNVIFIGDNGTPGQVIQTPYTAAKAKETIYEGGIRVPLIIAGPAVVSPNRTSTARVHAVDLYSTILEMAGINVSATQPSTQALDSQSVMSILQNTTTAPRYAFSQEFSADLLTSVSGRALVDDAGYTLLTFDDGREELYNSATDANQATNLLGTTISTAAQAAYAALKTQLINYKSSSTPSEPLLTSWFTKNSGEYARIYPTLADQTAQTSVTTWSRGTGIQSTPTYSDVHQVDYSANWVYIHTTGLASHTMGPWYLNAAKTNLFPNYPSNTAVKFRFPRVPTIPTNKVLTGLGATGRMVNGVSMFDSRDAFSYSNANGADATPGGAFTGDGIWNRDGYFNEGVTFDPALAHQAGNNYHYHAQPLGLRFQLGDHVDYNPTTNVYTESTTPLTNHSPIVAWASDGLPVYGPYGYSDPNSASSAVRRMVSGFVLRNGSNGTTNLTSTGRTTLPAWAARVQARSATLALNQYGPAVSSTFGLGKYIEDFDYLGDLGFTQGTSFDLNEQNVRFCVTPEFPAGTWAYFTTINADNTPAFPYTTGRAFYGTPAGGAVTSIAETVNTTFIGGPIKSENAGPLSVNSSTGDVTLSWSAVEGGVYQVQTSNDLLNWTALTPTITAVGDDSAAATEIGGAIGQTRRFYRTNRTSLSNYDKTGFAGTYFTSLAPASGGPNTVLPNSGSVGTAVNVIIELDPALTPALPPATQIVFSVTISGANVTASNITRPSQTLVSATFTIA
ncbi:MAG: sulfatase-like hydrolase/transferase, partial [Verrucomicrobia bacterium]|nr:sulfatase-like hydrolase/transferase [Verrucomicrobiota bacterium]